VTRLWIGRPWSRGWVPGNSKIFSLPQTGAWPTQPPTQYAPGNFSPDIKRSKRNPDHSLHLVPWLRMNGAVPPLPLCFPNVYRGKFNFPFIYMYVCVCVCVCLFCCLYSRGQQPYCGRSLLMLLLLFKNSSPLPAVVD